MKWLYGLGILSAISGAFLIFTWVPHIRRLTPETIAALSDIQQKYLRQNLSPQEKDDYIFHRNGIAQNQALARSALDRARHLGMAVCAVLLLVSVAGLVNEDRRAGGKHLPLKLAWIFLLTALLLGLLTGWLLYWFIHR